MNEIILKEENGKVLASSREVAEKFGKRHAEVIYAIEGRIDKNNNVKNYGILMNGNSQLSKMFIKSNYKDSMNREKYEYLMDRDGFSLLCMGFTGAKALEWKLKYINAFNQMEEILKSGNQLSEEERLKLQLFSKDASEVAYAHNRLVELATTPLTLKIEEQQPKVEYHDTVLNKDGLITTTVIAKDLGFKSAAKLNQIMNLNGIIFKNKSGTWCPYAEYEWLITSGYADYKSYEAEKAKPCLKWTEKGRKWIVNNYNSWVMKLVG